MDPEQCREIKHIHAKLAQRAKIWVYQPTNEFWAVFKKTTKEVKKEPVWERHSNSSTSRAPQGGFIRYNNVKVVAQGFCPFESTQQKQIRLYIYLYKGIYKIDLVT